MQLLMQFDFIDKLFTFSHCKLFSLDFTLSISPQEK